MPPSSSQQWDLALSTTAVNPTTPYWLPLYFDSRSLFVFGGPSAVYVVTADGYLVGEIDPIAGFHGWAMFQGLLYLQDGPVLRLYDLNAQDDFDTPLAAVNVVPPNQRKVYRPADGPWEDAQAWLYAHPAPGPLSAPLIQAKETYRSVYVLGATGTIAQFDRALGNGNAPQKPAPDALAWRLETVDGKLYICYSSHNTIETLDADSLKETPVPVPQPLPNGVGWVNARNFQEATQPTVVLQYWQSSYKPWAWASRVDGRYAVSGQLLVEWQDPHISPRPIITIADPGPGGWPVLGQGGMTTVPPPASVPSASLDLGSRFLVGPPLFRYEGDAYAAYVTTWEPDGTLHCQKWIMPPLADDAGLRQDWSDAYTGVNVARDLGLMERLLSLHILPPAFQALALARQMFDAGVPIAGPF